MRVRRWMQALHMTSIPKVKTEKLQAHCLINPHLYVVPMIAELKFQTTSSI